MAWSAAFEGQLGENPDFDGSDNSYLGLPWNDGLPWNCGGIISAESEWSNVIARQSIRLLRLQGKVTLLRAATRRSAVLPS
jgi:hypothetical protein